MNDLQIFENSEFGEIRTITKDNEPMFCLADVCKALELTNSRSVADRLEDDERCKLDLPRQGETWFVTESGLYAVILRSDKPNAKKFRKWVTGEVLPSIRKNGGYIANQENLTPEQIVANALVVAQNIITQKDKQIEELNARLAEVSSALVAAQQTAQAAQALHAGTIQQQLTSGEDQREEDEVKAKKQSWLSRMFSR